VLGPSTPAQGAFGTGCNSNARSTSDLHVRNDLEDHLQFDNTRKRQDQAW